MTDNHRTLFCLVDEETPSNAFPVKIELAKTVGHLKKLIKTEKTNNFHDVDANELTLWKVSILVADDDDNELPIIINKIPKSDKKKLKVVKNKISDVFGNEPDEMMIHIIVQRPLPEEKWRELVVQIEDDFFAPDLDNYMSIIQFLKADQLIPTTGGELGGLPSIAPWAGLLKD
ncbi:hypothetical protein BGZ74_004248 [Mortierella antarctica]|nr:hypothetical protein BGZ74_004248 [Mortierella antarctica]